MTAPRSLPVALKPVTISSPFGKIRTVNRKKTPPHDGCDWATPVGLPLESGITGTVVLMGGGPNHIWGYFVHIMCHCPLKHTQEFHILRELPSWLSEGDPINSGDLVGYTGRSGSLNGKKYDPHHHHGTTVAGVHYNPLTIGWPEIATEQGKSFDNTEEDDMFDERAREDLVAEIQQTRYLKLYVWGTGIIAVNPYGREWVLPNPQYVTLLSYLGLAPTKAIAIDNAQHGFIVGLLRGFLPARNFTDEQVQKVMDLSEASVAELVAQIGQPQVVLTDSQVADITAAAKAGAEDGVRSLSFVTTVR